ncbi:LAME_0F01618g1_1 [Lachancea meyersii CBS 8951]|uniref:LAME_0F01618g1_1 n=1 Tax=Lachancea meyersii CBS 8951 TaxID=1266667 RepID=A0A1G4JQ50_9SACH|nr:LAME_0F01618g1_1 [Lachancea meyersii CBS 8951]
MANGRAEQQQADDVQVSETINSALDQLHLDDLSDTSRTPTSKPAEPSTAATSSNNVFPPPPPLMGMGFMHYHHMMHLPHSPGFFQAPGSSDPFQSGPPADLTTSVDSEPIMFANAHAQPQTNSTAAAAGDSRGNVLDIGFSTNMDPFWPSNKQDYGPDYALMSGKLPEVPHGSRRQTFPAVSGNELLGDDNSAIRTQSISLEKAETDLQHIPKPAGNPEADLPKLNSSSVPYSAAAYPYGGPLVQPNPVLSGHTPPGSTPAYGVPSPFHAYGFSSPFQSFSPVPGNSLGGSSVNMPSPASGDRDKEGPVSEKAASPRAASSQPMPPWMYGNHHPFGPMVPIHHQMMGPHGNNNGNSLHPSHSHGNRHPMHSRRHKGNHNQKPYHRRGEDPAKYANAKLEDFVGNILSLCKDQHGCRFLQRQLDIGGPEAADVIFEETKSYVVELMTDSFGNYLIQKLLERVTSDQRLELVRSSAESFVYISLDPHGTRALQKLVECISSEEEAHLIVNSLRGSIVELSRDLNGNHVVQKCLQKLKPEDSQFIFDAATDACVKIATHRHGCCVLQRCLDHGNRKQFDQLCERIIEHVEELTTDPFGNYVVQYILTQQSERSEFDFTTQVVALIKPRVIELSLHKFGSNVVEKALRTPVASDIIINELLTHGADAKIEQLLHDGYGNYVLQTALDAARENKDLYYRLSDTLKPHLVGPIRNTPHGRRIMGILETE